MRTAWLTQIPRMAPVAIGACVSRIARLSLVALVDRVSRIARVSLVALVARVSHIARVSLVALLARVSRIARVSLVALVARVSHIARVSLVALVSSVSRIARVSLVALVALVAFGLSSPAAHADRDDHDSDTFDRDRDDPPARDVDLETDAAINAPLGALRSAPPVAEVLEAAYEAAGLDRDPTRSWIRRARIAGLVPWITVRTGWDASWRDEEPGEVGRGRTFEVRATWRLDRLLFDGRELQISSIDAARRRERRRLASHVIRAYFTWRKAAALAARNPSRFTLAAEAATAELDAVTDGWFSDRGKSTK